MDVGRLLRETSKGKLKYDRFWMEEGRTKETLDDISKYTTNISLTVSPKALSAICSESSEAEKSTCEEVKVSDTKHTKKSDSFDLTDACFFELQSELELPILEYEDGRLKHILEKFKSKQTEYENHSKDLQQQAELEYQFIKRKNELDIKRRFGDLEKLKENILKQIKEKESLQKQLYQNQAKKLSAKIYEAEKKQKEAEEESRKRNQEQEEFKDQLTNCQKEAKNIVSKSLEKLNFCGYPSHLKTSVSDHIRHLNELLQEINFSATEAQSKLLTIDNISRINYLVKKIYEYHQEVLIDIDNAKVKALQEQEAELQYYAKNQTTIPQTNTTTVSVEMIEQSNISGDQRKIADDNAQAKQLSNKDKLKEETKKIIAVFIAPDAVEKYHNIIKHKEQIETSLQTFINEARNKKYRFELQKSVNVPINAVSSVSGSHVRDKINRLLSILGNKTSESSSDSVAYNFCANLIAKQFVEQGDRQISAQHSTAFPIALAIAGVWLKKPEVGTLILGHFYTNCPYLVPYYPPRQEGQSDQDYYESLGYHFDREGIMEEKYKFLNRMSGYMRLYAAIIQSPLPPNTKTVHPHGIAFGWKWLSRTLNLDPRPDITATVIYDFLDVTGHALQKMYGKQFKKILHILCKDYFTKIKKVTPGGSGGPVERLKTFLKQTVQTGHVSPPEGILKPSFWNR